MTSHTSGEMTGQAEAPVTTFQEAAGRYDSTEPGRGISYARERFEGLTDRDLMARSLAKLQARGDYDPGRHPDPAKYPPMTPDERLEVLALGELLARHYRHPSYVHEALTAGASWLEIGEAVNCDQDQAREAYRQWADGQHRLWQDYEGKFGLDDAEHDEALRRSREHYAAACGDPDCTNHIPVSWPRDREAEREAG